jgi:hypothetical protein
VARSRWWLPNLDTGTDPPGDEIDYRRCPVTDGRAAGPVRHSCSAASPAIYCSLGQRYLDFATTEAFAKARMTRLEGINSRSSRTRWNRATRAAIGRAGRPVLYTTPGLAFRAIRSPVVSKSREGLRIYAAGSAVDQHEGVIIRNGRRLGRES